MIGAIADANSLLSVETFDRREDGQNSVVHFSVNCLCDKQPLAQDSGMITGQTERILTTMRRRDDCH